MTLVSVAHERKCLKALAARNDLVAGITQKVRACRLPQYSPSKSRLNQVQRGLIVGKASRPRVPRVPGHDHIDESL